jgi:hypothetical protein
MHIDLALKGHHTFGSTTGAQYNHKFFIMAGWIHNANMAVARSFVGKYFRLEGSGHVRIFDVQH